MEHFILRCKHCQKTYTYCTYGNGPEYGTEEGCSMEYCAECQKAINEALGKISVKFEPKLQYFDEPRLFPLFEKIKSDYEEKAKKTSWFGVGFVKFYCGKYDNCDTYVHNGITFNVEYNDDAPDDKHISIEMEYDIKKKKFTGNPWKTDEKDSYIHGRNSMKDLERTIGEMKKIEPEPMAPPTGKLFFNDFMWDVVPPLKSEPRQKEHKLVSYATRDNGAKIKLDCEHGYSMDHKLVFLEDVAKNSLIDFLEYEYIVEYYEDEDKVYYKDIHCI